MISLYITNAAGNNKEISPLGNSVTLNNLTLQLDEKKKYTMRLLQSNIVYCSPNVFTDKNNKLTYKYTNSQTNPQSQKTIEFDQGLYSLDDINSKISLYTSALEGNGSLFYFVPDSSTSKIYIVFTQPHITVYCNGTASIMPLLGFPTVSGGIGNYSTANYEISVNQANLNSVQSIYVKCDIVTGSYDNSRGSNIISSIIPDVSPFSTITYRPYFPPRCDVTARDINNITITLTDQDGKDLDMNTNGGTQDAERFGVLLVIEEDQLKLSHNQN